MEVAVTPRVVAYAGFARKVLIGLLLCATSVSSVPLWLRICSVKQPQRNREHRGCTEKPDFSCKPAQATKTQKVQMVYPHHMASQANITELLVGYGRGDKEALDQLMPIVYEELRRQAARYLRREQAGHTLQTTALIHEAYVRLVDQRNVQWQNRAHFFGIAAQLMRRILVDHARTKKRVKRGG